MKVIYFDSWAQGAKYYKELDMELSRNGCETKLMHIERLIGNSLPEQAKQLLKRNKTCIEHNIECEDASWEDSDYLGKILQERPDAIVMLSISRIENRLITRLCHQHSIPIYYMQHGSLFVNRKSVELDISRTAKINRFKIYKKVKKVDYILKIMRAYAKYFGITEASKIISQIFMNPYKFMWDPKEHISLIPTMAFAYTNSEKKAMSDFFKIPNERIQTVGNPRLYGLAKYCPKITLEELNKSINKRFVVYIDQAFLEVGWVSYEDQLEMISQIANELDSMGVLLVVKLHPRSNISLHDYESKIKNCRVLKDDIDLHDLLFYSSLVIGHSSTALTEAIAINTPVVTLNHYADARGGDLFNRALSINLEELLLRKIDAIEVSAEQVRIRGDVIGHMDSAPAKKIADKIINEIR